MKHTHHFFIFATILFAIYSCKSPSNALIPTEKWIKQENGRYKCELTNQFSTEQRRKMYPFNQAASVLFIAYENFLIFTYKTKFVMDTTYTTNGEQIITEKMINVTHDPCSQQKVIKEWRLTKEQGENVKYCAIESIKLNQAEIDTLSNILLNHKVSVKGAVFPQIKGCYQPRHSIIFLDKTGNVIGFIEICFECHRVEGSNAILNEISETRLCLIKLSRMEDLFRSVGIQFGIDTKH